MIFRSILVAALFVCGTAEAKRFRNAYVSFELPPSLVEAEAQQIAHQLWHEEHHDHHGHDHGAIEVSDEHRTLATRRVRLGLVLAEIGRTNNVTVSDQEVGQAMQQEAINMARQYGMQPQQVFDMLRQNPNAAAQIRAPLFEDKVVDLLFGQAKVTDKKVSKEELLKEDDLPAGYGG